MQRRVGVIITEQTQTSPGTLESYDKIYPYISEYYWITGVEVEFEIVSYPIAGQTIEIAINLTKQNQTNGFDIDKITHVKGHVTNIDPELIYQPGYINREIEGENGDKTNFYITEAAASGIDLRLGSVSGKKVWYHDTTTLGTTPVITEISNYMPHP